MNDLETILEFIRIGGWPVVFGIAALVIGKPMAKSIANWISIKSMEKHSGEDLAGQFNSLKRAVNNDMTHDIRDIKGDLKEVKKEVKKNSNDISFLRGKINNR